MMIKTWDFRDDYIDDEYQYGDYVNNWDNNFDSQNETSNA